MVRSNTRSYTEPVGARTAPAASTTATDEDASARSVTRAFGVRTTIVPSPPGALGGGSVVGGRYRVVRFVGGGSTGHVYEATHVGTTRRVALKVLREELARAPEIEARMRIEAEAATRVAHPNAVTVLDLGRDEPTGRLYLVEEFLDGETLRDRMLRAGILSLADAVATLWPVMDALVAAHAAGVTHRDLKPENIFLEAARDGVEVPKVIDFGLARAERSGASRLTALGNVLGTPSYMSPEQARGEADVDARTDVWALGVLWYEAMSGQNPFEGDSLPEIFYHVFMVDPVRLDAVAPEVPAAVADVVHRALAKRREDRFATMAEFLDALGAALHGRVAPPRGRWSLTPRPMPTAPRTALCSDAAPAALAAVPTLRSPVTKAHLALMLVSGVVSLLVALIIARALR